MTVQKQLQIKPESKKKKRKQQYKVHKNICTGDCNGCLPYDRKAALARMAQATALNYGYPKH